MSPIAAIIALAILLALALKISWWLDDSFNQLEEDRNEALDREERRDRAIEKLGSWLDRH